MCLEQIIFGSTCTPLQMFLTLNRPISLPKCHVITVESSIPELSLDWTQSVINI